MSIIGLLSSILLLSVWATPDAWPDPNRASADADPLSGSQRCIQLLKQRWEADAAAVPDRPSPDCARVCATATDSILSELRSLSRLFHLVVWRLRDALHGTLSNNDLLGAILPFCELLPTEEPFNDQVLIDKLPFELQASDLSPVAMRARLSPRFYHLLASVSRGDRCDLLRSLFGDLDLAPDAAALLLSHCSATISADLRGLAAAGLDPVRAYLDYAFPQTRQYDAALLESALFDAPRPIPETDAHHLLSLAPIARLHDWICRYALNRHESGLGVDWKPLYRHVQSCYPQEAASVGALIDALLTDSEAQLHCRPDAFDDVPDARLQAATDRQRLRLAVVYGGHRAKDFARTPSRTPLYRLVGILTDNGVMQLASWADLVTEFAPTLGLMVRRIVPRSARPAFSLLLLELLSRGSLALYDHEAIVTFAESLALDAFESVEQRFQTFRDRGLVSSEAVAVPFFQSLFSAKDSNRRPISIPYLVAGLSRSDGLDLIQRICLYLTDFDLTGLDTITFMEEIGVVACRFSLIVELADFYMALALEQTSKRRNILLQYAHLLRYCKLGCASDADLRYAILSTSAQVASDDASYRDFISELARVFETFPLDRLQLFFAPILQKRDLSHFLLFDEVCNLCSTMDTDALLRQMVDIILPHEALRRFHILVRSAMLRQGLDWTYRTFLNDAHYDSAILYERVLWIICFHSAPEFLGHADIRKLLSMDPTPFIDCSQRYAKAAALVFQAAAVPNAHEWRQSPLLRGLLRVAQPDYVRAFLDYSVPGYQRILTEGPAWGDVCGALLSELIRHGQADIVIRSILKDQFDYDRQQLLIRPIMPQLFPDYVLQPDSDLESELFAIESDLRGLAAHRQRHAWSVDLILSLNMGSSGHGRARIARRLTILTGDHTPTELVVPRLALIAHFLRQVSQSDVDQHADQFRLLLTRLQWPTDRQDRLGNDEANSVNDILRTLRSMLTKVR